MANESEEKRLADWKRAVGTYRARLEEMVATLGCKLEAVPSSYILIDLAKKSVQLELVGKVFRAEVTRAIESEPELTSDWEVEAERLSRV